MFQPELFQDLPDEQKRNHFQVPHFPGRFFRFRVAYEDAVFTLLGLILLVLAGFCVGVERGKDLGPQPVVMGSVDVAAASGSRTTDLGPVAAASGSRTTTAGPAPKEISVPASERMVPVIPAGVPPIAPVPAGMETPSSGSGGSFVIQLATYVGQDAAQVEIRRLSKKGTSAQVLKQGKYYELRAVGYRSKSDAKQALEILRQMYPDAFLKRVFTGPHN